MASKNPVVRLMHIKHELDWMLDAFQGRTYEDFASSIKNIRAVEHGFLIISEAVRTLPNEMTADHPHIAWAEIRAFGNVLRHDYAVIDPQQLWRTINDHLPGLSQVVAQLLEQHSRST